MGYVHCMPALCVQMTHGLDNIVTGVLDVDGRKIDFRTRSHIIKAVNKVYRGSAWKPSGGAKLLVDGELAPGSILIDHVEADAHDPADDRVSSPHLDEIAAMLPTHPVASKTLRVWKGDGVTRLRFADIVSRRDARGRIVEEILHGLHDEDGWHLWRVGRQGGQRLGSGIDAAVLTILGRAAGRALLTGETAVEEDRRQQAEYRQAAAQSQVIEHVSPPDDDCPF